MLLKYCFLLLCLLLGFTQCKSPGTQETLPSDDALMDTVQRRTFNYFWEGAEPNSGLARERIHMDGVYPENDRNVVTSGGSGFGIMAILAGIEDMSPLRKACNEWRKSLPSSKPPTAFTVPIRTGGMAIRAR